MNSRKNDLSITEKINEQRLKLGLLSVEEVLNLVERGNIIYNPYAFLISKNVKIGENNQFFSNIVLKATDPYILEIGSHNIFYSSTFLEAVTGDISIGNNNQFINGLFTIRTNADKAKVLLADNGRYDGNIKIYGKSSFGNGCQILGDIEVINCHLEGGESYLSIDVSQRGALLKGQGRAVNVTLSQGQVIPSQNGEFLIPNALPQTFFHPKSQKS